MVEVLVGVEDQDGGDRIERLGGYGYVDAFADFGDPERFVRWVG